MDLNLEFYDWVLSRRTLLGIIERLRERERREKSDLSTVELAKLCKAILNHSYLIEHVESAKDALRKSELYIGDLRRQQAKIDLCGSLNLMESAFSGLTLTLSDISFANCGLNPERVLPFLGSDENIVKWFFEDRVTELMGEERYDFVGFSLPAWEQFVPALTLASAIRERQGEQVHLCMGGNYITRLVGTWGEAAHPYSYLIDSFSVFEGEESLCQLLGTLAEGGPLDQVSNLVFRRNDALTRTKIGGVDINTIPTPDFDGLPLDKYFVPEPILPLYTSRSCPWKCSFCTIPYASSNFRQRKAERVAEDIATLKNKYGVRLYTFVDETLTVPMLRNASRAITARELDIRWYGETRVNNGIDANLCQQLFRSGCRKLQFGLESYNQRILDLMQKDVKIDHILPNIKDCLEAGISVHLFSFYGFPGETEAEARSTHEFSQAVLKLSREKYNNPFSTVGSGTFNLEVYSDVYYHPERYGVTLKNLSGPDASPFEIDYDVESGLTRLEALRLSRELNNSAIFHQVCDLAGQIWWESLSGMQTNEDEAFLLYCLGSETTAPAANSSHREAIYQLINLPEAKREVRLKPNILTCNFTQDFKTKVPTKPVVTFYDQSQDLVVNIPAHIGNLLALCFSRGNLPAKMDRHLTETVNRLLRHQIIEVDGEGVVKLLEAADLSDQPEATIIWNPDYKIFQCRPGRLEFFNEVSQNLLSLNALAAWIATLAQDRKLLLCELIESVRDAMPELTTDLVKQGIQELVEKGLLMALPTSSRGDYSSLQVSVQDRLSSNSYRIDQDSPAASAALRG